MFTIVTQFSTPPGANIHNDPDLETPSVSPRMRYFKMVYWPDKLCNYVKNTLKMLFIDIYS